MTEFQPVNSTLIMSEPPTRLEVSTPTTPRPNATAFPTERPADISSDAMEVEDVAKTPTRDSFAGLTNQRPLPSSPSRSHSHSRSDSKIDVSGLLKREGSHHSSKSMDATQDSDMMDAKDNLEDSDNDSNSDEPPNKKKKGQRFFCTDFPPCNLSFTRSEHLARHIRKHTGERPFQCHCSRRFSRLDNLRQHAQTVHVNEDIPGDSLAATGTRFQRQIRTERVRPPGSRSRASTLGSNGGHSRGHSRNLSTSSITSVASTISSLGGDDIMRRSTPILSGEHVARSRLSLDTYGASVMGSPAAHHFYPTGAQSPGGYSTPTSTTFSQGAGSPRFSTGYHSPAISASIPRSVGFESRTPARRLSVPSSAAFTPPHGTSYGSPYMSSVHSASGNSSMFASPTSSSYGHSRAESASSMDVDLKRRTWHPSINTGLVPRPGTSGLQQYQTPEQSRPLFGAEKLTGSATTRLPGIESFDHAPPPAVPRRVLSPMQIDTPQHQSLTSTIAPQSMGPPTVRDNRRSWDGSQQRGLSAAELEQASQQAERGLVSFGPVATQSIDPPRPRTSHVTFQEVPQAIPPPMYDTSRSRIADEPHTPNRNKRLAWYHGPPPAPTAQILRTSPDESGSSDGVPTPSNGIFTEANPAIVHSSGYIESRPTAPVAEENLKMQPAITSSRPPVFPGPAPQYVQYHYPPHQAQTATFALQQVQQAPPQVQHQALPQSRTQIRQPPPSGNDMQRLEALVAVATRENQAVSGN